jgi:hypothetical protein
MGDRSIARWRIVSSVSFVVMPMSRCTGTTTSLVTIRITVPITRPPHLDRRGKSVELCALGDGREVKLGRLLLHTDVGRSRDAHACGVDDQ